MKMRPVLKILRRPKRTISNQEMMVATKPTAKKPAIELDNAVNRPAVRIPDSRLTNSHVERVLSL